MNNLVLDPIVPLPIVVILALALGALTIRLYWKTGAPLRRWSSITLLLFRLAGLALILLLLLQPSRRHFLPPPTKERVTLIGVDTSLSMKQRDANSAARLDAAKNLLLSSGAVGKNGAPLNQRERLFQFGIDAFPLFGSALDLAPKAPSTRINQSVQTMLNSVGANESANALILLTDGHDFEMVNPVKTGTAARIRQTPIYAVALGKQGKVRDVSTRISGFQPYCYVKQKSRISAALRVIGCEYEDLTVQLLRQGLVVQTKRINADELQELPVEFEVIEPQTGQYEYEVRVQPLENEVDTANNSAITFLNVIDQQVRVLLVEGDPYWDTTFLLRSLMRNDKFDLDTLIFYGKNHLRAVRKTEGAPALKTPETLDQLGIYDLVLLGRNVDKVLGAKGESLLDAYVKDRSGTVVFTRGHPFSTEAISEMEPATWGDKGAQKVHLEPTAEGRSLSAFRTLNETAGGLDTLPDLVAGRKATATKPLSSVLAIDNTRDGGASLPAVIHRRYGSGQVISVGVEGLWRWGLNAKADGPNTPFDQFWDQMTLWLLAGRDFIPSRQFSFRPNSANILLGQKVYFHLRMRQPDARVKSVPLRIYLGDAEVGGVNMAGSVTDPNRLAGEYLPERTGRYRVAAKFPDGTSQESRFIVYNENLEETEVATDTLALRRLCESSGGRLLEQAELPRLLRELQNEKIDTSPKVELCPVWNTAWVFYAAGVLFGLDWFLRRRWGLC
jgi:hypothetical protein